MTKEITITNANNQNKCISFKLNGLEDGILVGIPDEYPNCIAVAYKGEMKIVPFDAKTEDLDSYLKLEDYNPVFVDGFVTKESLKDTLSNYAKVEDLPDMSIYVETSDLPEFEEFATKDNRCISGFKQVRRLFYRTR